MALALDNIYRNKYLEFECFGETYSSKNINWRQLPWVAVNKITVHLRSKTYVHDKENCPNFKFFLNFRWGGQEPLIKNGAISGHKKIDIWTIGYYNGIECVLIDYDFHTCNMIRRYTAPITEFIPHVHPSVQHLISS